MGAAATLEQLIIALQKEDAPEAWQSAAKHLLRIGGARLCSDGFCEREGLIQAPFCVLDAA